MLGEAFDSFQQLDAASMTPSYYTPHPLSKECSLGTGVERWEHYRSVILVID